MAMLKQQVDIIVVIILSRLGLCFTMVEASH